MAEVTSIHYVNKALSYVYLDLCMERVSVNINYDAI